MKFRIYALLWVALVGLLAGCRKDKNENGNEYESSRQAWSNFRNTSGNSYRYMATTASWTGFGTETTITVTAGKVTERKYVLFEINGGTGQRTDRETWTETGAAIGSHEAGEPAITLDEVYSKAKNEWLKKRDNTEIYFEAKNNGMISMAGYREKECVDDCFIGIKIGLIQKL